MSRSPYQHPLYSQHQQKWPQGAELFTKQLIDVAGSVRLQRLEWPELTKRGITAYMRRDDEMPFAYSGNKYYKLYYNLLNARQQGCRTLVSFGGAYSNHIYALAAAAHTLGLSSVGIVRGYPPKKLSPTLMDAERWGMKVHFLGKKDYAAKDIRALLPILKEMAGDYYLIPEGGENLAGVHGCMVIPAVISRYLKGRDYTLCTAVGTGSTLAGLIAGSGDEVNCLGISVLKGDDRLTQKVQQWLNLLGSPKSQWCVEAGFHHGGYAKVTPELMRFMTAFEKCNQIVLDPVYTAKMLWGIEQLAKNGYWQKGSCIVVLHSGGLQGRRGFGLPMEKYDG